ncbi:MAG: hypothetical protein PV358_19435, partial [Acidimicrobiales bacterium]|nr:hypothetical protein [Acidimicrobiales bacterium]
GMIGLVRGPLASGGDETDGSDRPDACPDAPIPDLGSAAADAQVVEGDVTGDGCTVAGVYGSRTLTDGSTAMVLSIVIDGVPKQIGLGGVGDQLVLGDWDCDGVDTPGVYQAAAGVVQYFDVWPAVEQRAYQPSGTEQVAVGGRAARAPGEGDDCDRVEVDGGTAVAGEDGGPAEISVMASAPRPTAPSR